MRKVIFIALSLLSVVGYGQGIKISALPQAGSLTGSELTPVVQNGITKKTSVQSIANLGGGGGSQNLQSVTTVGNTTSNNVQLLDSGNLIIGAYGEVLLDNSTSLKEGTFDNGTGGNKGISLNCAVGYELNWQGGHLSSSYNNGTTFYPVIIDSTLQLSGLGGSGSVIVTADNSGLLGKASLNNLAWSLTGNSGTNPATNFIGTTDGQPLTIKSDSFSLITYKDNAAAIIVGNATGFGANDSTIILNAVTTSINADNEMGINGKIITIFADTTKIKNALILENGTQGSGKVLTSDADGVASWQPASGGATLWDTTGGTLQNTVTTIPYLISSSSVASVLQGDVTGIRISNSYYLPSGYGFSGQVLTTDGAGFADWQTLALTDTATLNFGSISPNGHETLTMTVTGADLSDVVSLGIPNASMNDHASFVAWVSATNTVSVKCFNFDGSSFNPAAGLFTVKVFK